MKCGRVDAPRKAISLLEVILSLAILGGALAALGGVVSVGSRAAIESRDLNRAQIYCESKLSELLLADVAPQPIESAALAVDDSIRQWTYRVERVPAQMPGMLSIRVTVTGQSPDGTGRPVEFSLVRWMVDPALGLDQAEQEAAAGGAEVL